LRSAVGAVIYGITPIRKDHPVRQMVYFIADGALKSLEVSNRKPISFMSFTVYPAV